MVCPQVIKTARRSQTKRLDSDKMRESIWGNFAVEMICPPQALTASSQNLSGRDRSERPFGGNMISSFFSDPSNMRAGLRLAASLQPLISYVLPVFQIHNHRRGKGRLGQNRKQDKAMLRNKRLRNKTQNDGAHVITPFRGFFPVSPVLYKVLYMASAGLSSGGRDGLPLGGVRAVHSRPLNP